MVTIGRIVTSGPMNLVKVRSARALQVARCGGRRVLRRELLAVDYVLPLRRRRGDARQLELRTKGPVAAGSLYFGRESFPVDRVAYLGIFLEGWYDADYRDAVVVDIGGHMGYFGAFALHAGAGEVRSYEPEATNFATLERAARSFDRPWQVHRAAVGSEAGEATLHVNAESASHSIVHEQVGGARPTVGAQTVPVVPMAEVLADAGRSGRRVIVKVDAEGAECDIVLGTPPEAWHGVERVFLEIHDFAPCSAGAIIGHLRSAGMRVVVHERDDFAEADLVALAR
jgi:FkbM family methyltransferase